ncbi:putative Histone acetyltransferase type B subunit 2 [Blattamonas nauphoetae]|uniref:Histone acetyltransferase type B subunit 2 n=1 Tax=Blattamonas nauphoetae TaxID=2049346 RepID=A0ABQ9XIY7_9EUKA|nr:putative Histone acetyltransferase type B subunit 2 [Blattamonas nauphoetae]
MRNFYSKMKLSEMKNVNDADVFDVCEKNLNGEVLFHVSLKWMILLVLVQREGVAFVDCQFVDEWTLVAEQMDSNPDVDKTPFPYHGLPSAVLVSISPFSIRNGPHCSKYENGELQYSLLLGTQTSGQEQDSVYVATYRKSTQSIQAENSTEATQDQNQNLQKQLHITSKIAHNGDVNKLAVNPHNSSIIASVSSSKSVYVMDLGLQTNQEPRVVNTFSGLDEEGFGLSWNKVDTDRLCAASFTGCVGVWSIGQPDTKPLHSFRTNIQCSGCEWKPGSKNVIACGLDGGKCQIYDILDHNGQPAIEINTPKPEDVTSIAFNPHTSLDHLFLSGSYNGWISLWDLRQPHLPLHNFICHKKIVNELSWAPCLPPSLSSSNSANQTASIFASASDDCRVVLWDCRLIGEEITILDDCNDAPPEEFFVHSGHQAPVSSISWWPSPKPNSGSSSMLVDSNERYPWIVASTDTNNTCQVWKVAKGVAPLIDGDEEEHLREIDSVIVEQ